MVAALRAAGIPPIISFGSVLGFHRECGQIARDTDVDMWILRPFLRTPALYEAFIESMRIHGFDCATSHASFGEAGWSYWHSDIRRDKGCTGHM